MAGSHHIIPFGVYLKVLLVLLALTVLTVWVAQYDFGAFNFIVAFGIATIKATLVAAYFMHLLYDDKIYTVLLLSSVFFLILFWGLSILDIWTRVPQTSTL